MTNDTTPAALRIADQWDRNVGGYLALRPSNDGATTWILRAREDGTIIDWIGPFSSPDRARREAKYLAVRTA